MNQEKEDTRNKKKFLKRYLRIVKKIQRLEDKLVELDNQMNSPKIQKLSFMPRGGHPITLDDLLSDKEETQERINNLCVTAREIKREIVLCIDTLEDYRQVEILEKFFIDGLTLEDIAKDMSFNKRQVERLYGDGLKLLEI